MVDISFNTACKELKIAQIAQLNQLFQPLHLAHIYGHGFYFSPKGRWIVVDIYRDAKLYPPLFTDPEGDSCLTLRGIVVLVFTKSDG